MANVFLAGNLTRDPEPGKSNGDLYATFTVAVNRRHQVNGTWVDGATSFHRCVVWHDQAQRVLDDLGKGNRVIVVGELVTRAYKDKEGNPHASTSVGVDEVGPSLRFDGAAVDHDDDHQATPDEEPS